jgi:hypothetical protein
MASELPSSTLELGGNDPAVVLDDVDVQTALDLGYRAELREHAVRRDGEATASADPSAGRSSSPCIVRRYELDRPYHADHVTEPGPIAATAALAPR